MNTHTHSSQHFGSSLPVRRLLLAMLLLAAFFVLGQVVRILIANVLDGGTLRNLDIAWNMVRTGRFASPIEGPMMGSSTAIYLVTNRLPVLALAGMLALLGKAWWWYTVALLPVAGGTALVGGGALFGRADRLGPAGASALMLLLATDPMVFYYGNVFRSEIFSGLWALACALLLWRLADHPGSRGRQWAFAVLVALGGWITVSNASLMIGFFVGLALLDASRRTRLAAMVRTGLAVVLAHAPYYGYLMADAGRWALFREQLSGMSFAADGGKRWVYLLYGPLRTLYEMVAVEPSTLAALFIVAALLLSLGSRRAGDRLSWVLLPPLLIPLVFVSMVAYVLPARLFVLIPLAVLVVLRSARTGPDRALRVVLVSILLLLALCLGFGLLDAAQRAAEPGMSLTAAVAAYGLGGGAFLARIPLQIWVLPLMLLAVALLRVLGVRRAVASCLALLVLVTAWNVGVIVLENARLSSREGALLMDGDTARGVADSLAVEFAGEPGPVFATKEITPLFPDEVLVRKVGLLLYRWRGALDYDAIEAVETPRAVVLTEGEERMVRQEERLEPFREYLGQRFMPGVRLRAGGSFLYFYRRLEPGKELGASVS